MQCVDILDSLLKTTMKKKTYSELSSLETFDERLEYLYIGDKVGNQTFGNARWLNQKLYKSPEWQRTRDRVITRDLGCDLGVEGCELTSRNILIHHINPITEEDVINRNPCLFDMDNLIAVSLSTHNYIHYGTKQNEGYVERKPNDTCPWRR